MMNLQEVVGSNPATPIKLWGERMPAAIDFSRMSIPEIEAILDRGSEEIRTRIFAIRNFEELVGETLTTAEAAKVYGTTIQFWSNAVARGCVKVVTPGGEGRGRGAQLDAQSVALYWQERKRAKSA